MNMVGAGPAVVIRNLAKRYDDVTAVDDVSMVIERGEFFSLLGPSGCGKTTLLRCIAGFIAPDAGSILLEGKDVSGVPPHRRPSNMVFQDYALFPHLSVAKNVAFGLEEERLPKDEIAVRVDEALSIVQLEPLAKRRPSQLSGGQRQRVALARALIKRPVVLLLDEPLGALDLKLRKAMQFELKRIQREVGITFVYVTHDQDEALTMSDRIAVMNAGRCEQLDTPENIYERPASRFVADFIGEANLLAAEVADVGTDHLGIVLRSGAAVRVTRNGRPVTVGERPTMLIRPEQVRISGEEPVDGRCQVMAVLAESAYQGSHIRYVLELDGGDRIVADVPRDARPDVHPGDRVWVSWDASSARLLEEQGTRSGRSNRPGSYTGATRLPR
jgi:spermidine/putrescine transport system ATP-binding protein